MRRAHLALCLAAAGSLAVAASARAATTTSRPAKSAGQAMTKVLPWVEDDYAGAVTKAKARKLPIFVESWAPW